MNAPTIPTDNLYKFMAIVGLLIATIGLLLPVYFEFNYATLHSEWSVKEEVLRLRAETAHFYGKLAATEQGLAESRRIEVIEKIGNAHSQKAIERLGRLLDRYTEEIQKLRAEFQKAK